jgi:RecJ-like exonuclease
MSIESCGICGGDGRIANSFGNQTRCPSCHGTGRRSEDGGLRDVTKTKASHHQATNRAPVVVKQTWPTSVGGDALANEVKACPSLSEDTKARLTREIIDHESTHGSCTQTFLKKIRKQLRPTA